jgi:hypothetical protein
MAAEHKYLENLYKGIDEDDYFESYRRVLIN